MNSHRPRSQNTAKEQALIPEKDSKRKRPRCHVILPDVTPQPANFSATIFGGFATWWSQFRQNFLPFFLAT
jgi:hypothetical protein